MATSTRAATAAIRTGPLTYDDIAAFPNDGWRYEIIDGELFMAPAPWWWHERLSRRVERQLDRYLEPRDLADGLFTAPTDVYFSNERVVQPDLVYVNVNRRDVYDPDNRFLKGVPDLGIEILSPSTRRYDEVTKARLYAEQGVPEYWMIDGENKTVSILALRDGAYVALPIVRGRVRSEVLPRFELNVPALFAGMP